jgi:hypothetical protein
MPMPDRSRPTELAGLPSRSVTARVLRAQTDLTTRIAEGVWSAVHALGAHRWRDGYETDAERGWSRYRGSRCTICDEPWEGW